MGQVLGGRRVKCPDCGKVQYSEGSIFFTCCSKEFPIDQNLYEGSEGSDVEERLDDEICVPPESVPSERTQVPSPIPSEQSQTLKFVGGSEDMVEEENVCTCQNCNTQVKEGQKFCPGCGQELVWQ